MIAIVGAGANLGARRSTLALAKLRLQARGVRVLRCSHTYSSAAWVAVGAQPGPDFLNEAWRLSTTKSPHRLLDSLLEIEAELGRVRTERWAARTLDLDILWLERPFESKRLVVPHTGLSRRPFALRPLLDVAPELGSYRRYLRSPPRIATRLRLQQTTDQLRAVGEPLDALARTLNVAVHRLVPAATIHTFEASLAQIPDAIARAGLRIRALTVLGRSDVGQYRLAVAGIAGRAAKVGAIRVAAGSATVSRV